MIECLIGRIRIFGREPERAAVGIERHCAVIAPSRRACLRTSAGEERLLS